VSASFISCAKCRKMRSREIAVMVLDQVQVLDEQIAPARPVAKEREHFFERLGIDLTALRRARRPAPAGSPALLGRQLRRRLGQAHHSSSREPRRTANGFAPFLDRSHTIAKPGFSRWMVPPAALCIHLCIGQAYAFSVFNLPMTKLIGITQSTPDDWKLTELGWIFSIAIFVLGVRRHLRPLGRGRRSAPGHVHWPAYAGHSAFSFPRSASMPTISGSSISAMACSAASGLASATSRRSRP
jgi:hypothetical protein